LNIVPAKDRAKWLEALKLDCPWVAPGFDLEAWKAKKADGSRRALAFFEVFEKLDETLIWGFFEAVLAERDRDDMPGLLPLAERLADTCVSWGLPVPPDDFDLVGLATHCTA
jgi:hypothetical protein